jgi:hypothetical protein
MTAATATDTRHTHSTSTVSSMLCGPVSHYTASSNCNWASFPRDSGCAANEGIFYPTTAPSSCTPANCGCSDNDFKTATKPEDLAVPSIEKIVIDSTTPLKVTLDLYAGAASCDLSTLGTFPPSTDATTAICYGLAAHGSGGFIMNQISMVGMANNPTDDIQLINKVGIIPLDSSGFLHHDSACQLTGAQSAGMSSIPASCLTPTDWSSATSSADLKAMRGYHGRAGVVILKRTFCVKSGKKKSCHVKKIARCFSCDNQVFNGAAWFATTTEKFSFVNGGCVNPTPCDSTEGHPSSPSSSRHPKASICSQYTNALEKASCFQCTADEWVTHADSTAHGAASGRLFESTDYTGTDHGCSTAHSQCYWNDVATAKRNCQAWAQCGALYCTDKWNGGAYVCYAATGASGSILAEAGSTTYVYQTGANTNAKALCEAHNGMRKQLMAAAEVVTSGF